jgi:Dolichyl-phosphate-mannose-protein mannosyltransferase
MSSIAAPRQGAPARGADLLAWLYANRVRIAIACTVLLVVLSQGINMSHYPYLEDDEGTYFSQGWAVFHLGRLTPYTYIYDHAPLGWIQIGIWQLLTLGHRFGEALESGRVLMLLYQVGSALLVLGIGRRASGKTRVGLLAAVLFSLSTYGIFYHRRILLDNVATFWMLLGIYLLVGRVTLGRVWLSAVAIGIAILSKEVAMAVVPALAILVARRTTRFNGLPAVAGWCALVALVCFTYVLMALLKGELFAAGTPLGGTHPHVSLICSVQWQASRASDGGIFSLSGGFWQMVRSWSYSEPLLVIGGTAAALACVSALRRNPVKSMLGWCVLSLWLFLGRGGVVLAFYLVPLLPLLALCLALVLHDGIAAVSRLRPRSFRRAAPALGTIAVAACASLLLVAYERSDRGLWTSDPVAGQIDAVSWIQHHVPPSSRLVIDEYMWEELHDPPPGAPRYRDAQYYWKAGEDPAVRRQSFNNNWRNVDYVVTTPQLVYDTMHNDFPIVTPALEHSLRVAAFNTGGWQVEVRRVDPRAPVEIRLSATQGEDKPACMTYS